MNLKTKILYKPLEDNDIITKDNCLLSYEYNGNIEESPSEEAMRDYGKKAIDAQYFWYEKIQVPILKEI